MEVHILQIIRKSGESTSISSSSSVAAVPANAQPNNIHFKIDLNLDN